MCQLIPCSANNGSVDMRCSFGCGERHRFLRRCQPNAKHQIIAKHLPYGTNYLFVSQGQVNTFLIHPHQDSGEPTTEGEFVCQYRHATFFLSIFHLIHCLGSTHQLPTFRDSDPESHSRHSPPLPLRCMPSFLWRNEFIIFRPRRLAPNCAA